MRVRLVCFGVLRERLPSGSQGNAAWAEVAPGATVIDLAKTLGVPQDHLFAILVNGRRVTPSEGLREGDEVTLMPPFSGG